MQRIKTISMIEDTGGVAVAPIPLSVGGDVTIVYNGLLASSGADSVNLHLGYGYDWHGVQDVELFRTSRGWENTIKVDAREKLNLCFKDSAGNWDNNNGYNWSYEINSY